MYALVDCNNFYASCERVFRPDLNGKPIVVLSNNDGCVIARSNEAKAIGVPMGAPAFEQKALFNKHNVKVFSANFALYGDMSNRVMSIIADLCPDQEIYSIDECFLNLEGYSLFDLKEYGVKMRQRVLKWTSIPVSIGIAPTKALAKLANRIAKKYPDETSGVHIINDDELRIKALKWCKVEDVWGIGRQNAKKLNYHGIKTAYQFTQQSDPFVKKQMSVVGLRLKMDLMGKPSIQMEDVKLKQSIATTRTFEENYIDYDLVRERISTFAITCAEKLRRQKSLCNSLLVFINTNNHRIDLSQYSNSIVIKLPYPTNSSIELSKFATKALERIFIKGYAYKKAGVILMDFTPENNVQLNLFQNSNPRHASLMKVMDKINDGLGHNKLKLASQDLGRTWKMHQEKLSPRYTTNINEIITIKAY